MPTCLRCAQRVCSRWQKLVSPDRRLYVVTTEAELQKIVPQAERTAKAEKARRELLKNLRQLLGWTAVGNCNGDKDDRRERKMAGNWQPLVFVTWIKHDNAAEIVPLVGSHSHKYKTVVMCRIPRCTSTRPSCRICS